MIIALVGNPNTGKTTLFNELTKLNQKMGNWPGVTIEKKEGKYYRDKDISIIDLPGIYSLNPITLEEKVSCAYLKETKVDAIINVIDSSNLERNLNLSLQLLETDIPMVLAFNMEDELKLNGLALNLDTIKEELHTEVMLISALKNKNLIQLIEKAKMVSAHKRPFKFVSYGDTEEEKAEYRNKFIKDRIDKFRTKSVSRLKIITEKIDKIVMNKWLAFPIFVLVIGLMYYISIESLGALAHKGMQILFTDLIGKNLEIAILNSGAAPWVSSLVVKAVIGGVGAVLSFIPQILILFLFITFLEGCGYMARIAVIMDRIFRKIGLSGKSFIPMIVGAGCSVPAIMASKTIEGDKERKATIMLTPFVPCSAKLPVFALIAGTVLGSSLAATSMYFLGILVIILAGLVLKFFRKKSGETTFLIELTPYRLPRPKNIIIELWDKSKDFIIRAGVIILPATIILWLLQSFSFSFQYLPDAEIGNSILASIGKIFAPVFYPLGFGNWQASISAFTGFFAKETIGATFEVLSPEGMPIEIFMKQIFTPQAAYAFMAFVLFSPPCIAAIAAMKKEMGYKWMFIAITFQFIVGYIVALIINQLGNAFVSNLPVFITVLAVLAAAVIVLICVVYLFKHKKKVSCGNCIACKNKGNCGNVDCEKEKI